MGVFYILLGDHIPRIVRISFESRTKQEETNAGLTHTGIEPQLVRLDIERVAHI